MDFFYTFVASHNNKNKVMSYYQKSIIEITGADAADAKQVEELMRDTVGGTLDHISRREFARLASDCYKAVQWMKTPEGAAYMARLDAEILGE